MQVWLVIDGVEYEYESVLAVFAHRPDEQELRRVVKHVGKEDRTGGMDNFISDLMQHKSADGKWGYYMYLKEMKVRGAV